MHELLRIDAPFFVAGVVIRDGRVAMAAPIVRWMVGWPEARVHEYAERRGWAIQELL